MFGFVTGEGDIVIRDIQCVGDEINLLECNLEELDEQECLSVDYTSQDPGVSCGNSRLHIADVFHLY